jgi:hypothetical protein
VPKQGDGTGVNRQLKGSGHGGKIGRLGTMVRAPGHPTISGLTKLAGGAPVCLPLAQGQASSGLAIPLPAGKKVLQGRQNLIRHRKSPQLLAKSAIAPSIRVIDKAARPQPFDAR